MSNPPSSSALRLPAGFRDLLEELALEVLRAQPADVVAFAARHFRTLLERREASSADPAARGAPPGDEVLARTPFPEDEEKEDEEKKDEEKEDEEKAAERAGGAESTDALRDAAPAPKTGLSEPQTQHQGSLTAPAAAP